MTLRAPVRQFEFRGHALTEPAPVNPITLDSLKAALIITGTDDDEILTEYASTATEYIENITGLAMISQEWLLSLDNWPGGVEPWWDGVRQGSRSDLFGSTGPLLLPRYPLASVDTVTVYDEAGASSAVVIGDTFDIDTYQKPGRMVLKRGATWPVALRAANAIQIGYTAGFGADGSLVPATLRSAVRQMAAYLYTHRGDGCDVGDAYQKSGAVSLVAAHAVARL